MTLTAKQKKALEAAPPQHAIKTRNENGTPLSYLEGWYVIQEANKIFGAENWDRITLTTQCVWHGRHDGKLACSYTARVRLCVRTKTETFVREGSGVGHGFGAHLGEAHGNAIKAAETDATKRAFATLGAPFGLTLYDVQRTEAACETEASPSAQCLSDQPPGLARTKPAAAPWIIQGAAGETVGAFSSPILGCSSLRRTIDQTNDRVALEALFGANRRFLARLAAEKPDLRDRTNRHYSEILSALYQAKLKRLSAQAVTRPSADSRNDMPFRAAEAASA